MKNIGLVVPPNLGWLQIELDEKEINYLWELVKNKKDNTKHNLAGHIDSSYTIVDKGNWFFNNVFCFIVSIYKFIVSFNYIFIRNLTCSDNITHLHYICLFSTCFNPRFNFDDAYSRLSCET